MKVPGIADFQNQASSNFTVHSGIHASIIIASISTLFEILRISSESNFVVIHCFILSVCLLQKYLIGSFTSCKQNLRNTWSYFRCSTIIKSDWSGSDFKFVVDTMGWWLKMLQVLQFFIFVFSFNWFISNFSSKILDLSSK